jgi:hypothetical protein
VAYENMISLSMISNMRKFVQLLAFLIFIGSLQVRAQSANPDELMLDDEVNQATTPAPTTLSDDELTLDSDQLTLDSDVQNAETKPAKNLSTEVSEPATALEPQAAPPRAAGMGSPEGTSYLTPEEMEDEPQQDLAVEYAMKGYSFGFLGMDQSFDVNAAILINGTTNVDLHTHSADFQSVGGMLRYAILPYYKIGTDLTLTGGTTLNHESVHYTSINFAKAIVSLGYAIELGSSSSLYFLLGGGFEYVSGIDINKIMKAAGATYQVGAGIGLARRFNIEIYYAYSSHPLSDDYLATATAAALVQNPSATVENAGSSSVTSSSVIGNLNYSF